MRTGENIYKRKDGRYEARYKDGYKPNGSTKYRSVYGKTYSEVKNRLDIAKAQESKPLKVKNLILNDIYKMYMEDIRYQIKASTLSTYEQLYNKHISPSLGGLKGLRIDEHVINGFVKQKLSSGLSSKYVNDIAVLLLAIIRFGIRKGYLMTQSFELMKFRVNKPKVIILTQREQSTLERYLLANISLRNCAVLLSLFTGVRVGELCALQVGDFEIDNNILHITKTLQRIKNPNHADKSKTIVIVDTPKSEKSIRDIPIPQFLSEIIKTLIQQCHKNAYFLTGQLSHFVEPRLLEYHFFKILKTCNIETKNFHILRHTFATNAIRYRYFDIKSLSEILGHSSVKITYDKYVHCDMESQQNQMQRIHNDFLSRQVSCQFHI